MRTVMNSVGRITCEVLLLASAGLMMFTSCRKENTYISADAGAWVIEKAEQVTTDSLGATKTVSYDNAGSLLLYHNGSRLANENLCEYHIADSFHSAVFSIFLKAGKSEKNGLCFWMSGPNDANRVTLHTEHPTTGEVFAFTLSVEKLGHNRAKWHYIIDEPGRKLFRETYTLTR